MGRANRRERGRLWAWICLALFDGDEIESGPGAARDTEDEPADDRSGE
ncbi:hypothetical protein ACFQE8_11410 [Salinirubellus sp. GCM10025818]